MNLENMLLLYDPDDPKDFGLDTAAFEQLGIRILQTKYNRIGHDSSLTDQIKAMAPSSILFTRNEAMGTGAVIGTMLGQVKAGYTCLSAIDPEFAIEQTKQCINDFFTVDKRIDIPPVRIPEINDDKARGTFSFIFDFEQFGCARFGVPRLLPLIEEHGICATFFTTGFMAQNYPEVLKRIVQGGHEIGAHGREHEFLSELPVEKQCGQLRNHVDELSEFAPISGANFIYRMNNQSPDAFVQSGLKYFVNFRKNVFYRTRFIEASSKVRLFETSSGSIKYVPIGVETYSVSRLELEGAIRTGLKVSSREGRPHISILMHPFKDGMLSRLELTKWLTSFLIDELKLRPVLLNEITKSGVVNDPESRRIYYPLERIPINVSTHSRLKKFWWFPEPLHLLRVEKLANELELDSTVALTSEIRPGTPLVCVYPDTKGNARTIHWDPIGSRGPGFPLAHEFSYQINPPNLLRDVVTCVIFHIPRSSSEIKAFVLRMWDRLKLKLGKVL